MRDWMHLSTANRIAIPARTRLIRELRADCVFNTSTSGFTAERVRIALTRTEVDHEKHESNEFPRLDQPPP